MKPKILFLITELRPAGAEKIVFSLATRLKETFEVHVACISHRRGAVGDWLKAAGIPVLYLDMAKKYELWKLLKLYHYLRKNQIQILHTHLFHANILGRVTGFFAGVRQILSSVHIVERRFRPWHFWLESLTHPLIRYEVGVSPAVTSFMKEKTWIPERKFRTILNGIDLKPFQEASKQKYSKKEILGVSEEQAWILGSVGRLTLQKGYLFLIEVYEQFRKQCPEPNYLVIIGEGEERHTLEEKIRELHLEPYVFLLGYRQDIPACLRCFDLFVMPSLYEGFGLVAVEAMASGVPVLANAVDSLKDLIEEGKTGFLVTPQDSQKWTDKLMTLFVRRDHLTQIIETAKTGAQQFREDRMVEEYKLLYSDMLASKI
ncbi:MAG: glycosyltransferase [Planctomycetota bacterium]